MTRMRTFTIKAVLCYGISAIALSSTSALAQDPAQDAIAQAGAEAGMDKDIVVTGSRLPSGFEQPTPVTVITTEQLQAAQPAGIAAGLNQLPQFSGSISPRQQQTAFIGSFVGNVLNLRNVGGTRTLILQDGVRVPPTTAEGAVNVDIIPEMLVSRVDVVTAGVSAVYGSDAVSGVVNFVIDKRFKGLKLLAQRGLSNYRDAASYRIGAAFGQSFLDDRLHLLVSVERNDSNRIRRYDRPFGNGDYWGAVATGTGAPGTTTNPYYFSKNVFASNLARVAKISAGPPSLLNKQFSDTGQLIPFDTGTFGGGLAQIGGSGVANPNDRTLVPDTGRDQGYARLSMDLTPDITLFAEATGARVKSAFNASQSLNIPVPIFAGNAFLTPELNAAIAQPLLPGQTNGAPVTCASGQPAAFCVFTPLFYDWPAMSQQQRVKSYSAKAGIQGKVGDWAFDLTYVHGRVKTHADEFNSIQIRNLWAAADAVRDPATNNIVCRVALTNPGAQPGCAPINFFGLGTKSAASAAYILGTSTYDVVNKTNDVVFTLSGQPFSTWAGPVGLAVGLEYRDGSLTRTSNSDPTMLTDTTGIRGLASTARKFVITNTGVAFGANDVKEANIEVSVPLAADMAFARALTVTGAARYTDYSTSGSVWSWKLGATYEPIEDIRFRVTRSRDIRAPTLFDLFAGGVTGFGTANDPHCNCVRPGGFITRGGGNPLLKPEIANTLSAGVILQPRVLPGFSFSADYYDLKLTNAITTLSAAQILQNCENSSGVGPSCAAITRPLPYSDRSATNAASEIFIGSINAASLRTSGVDFEGSYHTRVGEAGDLNLRLLGNYLIRYDTQSLTNGPIRKIGGWTDSAIPKLTLTATATYRTGPVSLFVQERRVGSIKPGNQFVYPVKKLPATYYSDVTASVDVKGLGGTLQIFATVNNLLNQKPRLFPDISFPSSRYPTIMSLYDVIGRYVTVGAKMNF